MGHLGELGREIAAAVRDTPSTAAYRRAVGGFRRAIGTLAADDVVRLADDLLAGRAGSEAKFAGVLVLAARVGDLGPEQLAGIEAVGEHLDRWGLVDAMCVEVLGPLLCRHPGRMLEMLGRYNRSPNPNLRRTSVVAFTRKVGMTGRFTAEMLELCENLLWDSDDLVRKGVGWALKDNLRSAPDVVLPYVVELRRRGVSSTITLYAIRDLRGAEREAVLAIEGRRS